jgi:hypothetical protein
MSAHPGIGRRGLVAAVAAQISSFLLEPPAAVAETGPVELEPYPVVAVLSAAPRCGATTVARALGAELAVRADGAAVVSCRSGAGRATAPPLRMTARLATALRGVGDERARPAGRVCLLPGASPGELASAARYLAPVVLDVPPDGSAAATAQLADRAVVVAAGSDEPALTDVLACLVGGQRSPLRVTTRVVDGSEWTGRADVLLPEGRIAARSALAGARPLGPFGKAIAELADALELDL